MAERASESNIGSRQRVSEMGRDFDAPIADCTGTQVADVDGPAIHAEGAILEQNESARSVTTRVGVTHLGLWDGYLAHILFRRPLPFRDPTRVCRFQLNSTRFPPGRFFGGLSSVGHVRCVIQDSRGKSESEKSR